MSRAKKSLGQNFLVDPNLQRKIVGALDAGPDDEVLEIGPGRGALTRHLAGTVRRLVLVELDDDLAAELEATYARDPSVEVRHGDILDIPLRALSEEPGRLRVIGNIPYNITTPILFHVLERPRPAAAVIMTQKEVAERITADAGTSAYGALAVGVRTVADVEAVTDVPRHVFRPVPGVDSTVLRIVPHDPPRLTADEEARLRTLTRAVFQWRRKQLQKTLRDHPDLEVERARLDGVEEATGIELRRRPESLDPDDFVRLSRVLSRLDADPLGRAD